MKPSDHYTHVLSSEGKVKLVWGYSCFCGNGVEHKSHHLFFKSPEDASYFAEWFLKDEIFNVETL